MRIAIFRAIALMMLIVMLGGCAQVGQGISDNPKATMGGMLGAAGGGLIAAAAGGGTAGIIGGVLIGGLLGGALGGALDSRDKQLAAQNAQNTFENARTGETSTWKNPDSGHSGSITPTNTFQNASGQYCREYQQTINVGGQKEQGYGTACRQPDGSWKIVSS
ncbi:MAG TPA: RT0821/Lpp0805 family surface protein [Myxococcota bacterium]|nr:RT0821/Lpp0805 family surface protein [Myxococcota bacterium]